MSRTALQLAASTPRNRISGVAATFVLFWCILSPLPVALLSNFESFTDVIGWQWWLPAASSAVAVVLNLPTPHIPRELVRGLDHPDRHRTGRGALFWWSLGATIVIQVQYSVLAYDDPRVAIFVDGQFPPVQAAAWVTLAAAAVVLLRSLAGTLGWVPAGWQELTEDDLPRRVTGGSR
ncbi:hypothetical protein [Promicromonospora sp. NPDC023987]|uniref:hypothetical protein n=1 Tax=Promicromonospora sp. NPDC023987 TaxID=3155360 RepID=UPI0033CC54F4